MFLFTIFFCKWVNLFSNFDKFYKILYNTIKEWNIDGLDLNIKNNNQWQKNVNNYDNIIKLIKRLKKDFGNEFIIVLSPLAYKIYS